MKTHSHERIQQILWGNCNKLASCPKLSVALNIFPTSSFLLCQKKKREKWLQSALGYFSSLSHWFIIVLISTCLFQKTVLGGIYYQSLWLVQFVSLTTTHFLLSTLWLDLQKQLSRIWLLKADRQGIRATGFKGICLVIPVTLSRPFPLVRSALGSDLEDAV